MLNKKPRILFITEASWLSTGYAVYSKQLYTRLYQTNKYELFELSIYGDVTDPRANEIPWVCFPNLPSNKEEQKIYESDWNNQFGAWKFENICLEILPDVVMDIRDAWHNKFEYYSPLRPFYNLIHMLPVDAEPLEEDWVADYISLDKALTYTDFGNKIISKFMPANKIAGIAPGGTSDKYKPVPNKAQHKKQFGIDENSIIVGMVARNQPRKLYPQLIRDFAATLSNLSKDYKDKTYLYLHTAYPDIGWDIPRLLNKYNIGHKVLFTYHCKQCGLITPSFYQDTLKICPNCNQHTMILPTVNFGISEEALSKIYNFFDIYVQYSNMEGLGLTQIDAAYCGLPIMTVNYSGMEDVVNKLCAVPINVGSYNIDHITGRNTAIPDSQDFVNKLINMITLPNSVRHKIGYNIKELAHKHFNWELSTKSWMNAIDNCNPKKSWTSPIKLHNIPSQYPNDLDVEKFIRWCFNNIADRPDLANSYLALKYNRDLSFGYMPSTKIGRYYNDMSNIGDRAKMTPYNKQDFVNELIQLGESKNYWEKQRAKACNINYSL